MMSGRMARAIEMRIIARDIVREALNRARREIWRELLSSSDHETKVLRTNVFQRGYPPGKIDAVMDRFIAGRVNAKVPSATYMSEESTVNLAPEMGDIIAWCDPLDGTTNALTVLSDYAIVLFFEEYRSVGPEHRSGFDHLGGAIASSDGTVVSWQQYQNSGEVWVDWASDFWPAATDTPAAESLLDIDPKPVPFSVQVGIDVPIRPRQGKSNRIASVAAPATHRNELDEIYDLTLVESGGNGDTKRTSEDRWLSTLGGNPCIAPLLLGQLGAIIEPTMVDKHDAIYLVPLTLAGGKVIDLQSRKGIRPLDVFTMMEPGGTIEPFIAFINDDVLKQLRNP